ncbi:TPA: hypothetical protein ON570_004944 [Citrobacter werkmanii]|nr:hypothetical protein [Citrobacter werkmanii]
MVTSSPRFQRGGEKARSRYVGGFALRDGINQFLQKKKKGIRGRLRQIHVTNKGQFIIAMALLFWGRYREYPAGFLYHLKN